jgi:hypothetical protein
VESTTGGCVTTVVPVVGDVCTVVVSSVTVGLVVLTDTVVDPWVDVLTSGEVVVDCTVLTSNITNHWYYTEYYRDSDISSHTTSYFSGINNNFNRDNSTKQYY